MKVPKILAEQFELLADAPNGVEKLRELVFGLAVQGKLVEQDGEDSPAEETLQALMRKRKRRWFENLPAGSSKKYKEREGVQSDELPVLPSHWLYASPDQIAADVPSALTIGPFGSNLLKSDYRGEGIPLVFVRDIRAERFGGPDTRFVTQEKAASLSPHTVRGGDLLITKMGDPPGDTAIYPENRPQAIITADCIKLTPEETVVCTSYLRYAIRSQTVGTQIQSITAGVAHQKVSLKRFRIIGIPLPPLAEQQRIVAKVDELLALCDELEERQGKRSEVRIQACTASHAALTSATTPKQFARHWTRIRNHFDRLYDTPQNVQELRQVLLQLAMQGKLVPQDSNDELRVKLLDAPKRANQRQPKWAGPIEDLEKPFQLPSSWAWFRLGDISSLKHGYAFSSKYFTDEAADFVLTTPGNFYEKGGFRDRESKRKYYSGPVDSEFVFKPGDLIIPMTEQAAGLLGSPAFIPDDGRVYVHNQRLGKFRFSESIAPEFAFWFFNCEFFRSELARTCTGMKVRHTSPDRILRVPFPVCPLAEQERIVAKVDQMMSICDDLESKLTQSQADSEKLMEAGVAGVLNTHSSRDS